MYPITEAPCLIKAVSNALIKPYDKGYAIKCIKFICLEGSRDMER